MPTPERAPRSSVIGTLRCSRCAHRQAAVAQALCCERCQHGLLLLTSSGATPVPPSGSGSAGVWKRPERLPAVGAECRLSLGEGGTPLLALAGAGPSGLRVKYEGVAPTQSWKDRFNAVNVSVAKHWAKPGVALKSTGNAALSAAAYCAAGGLRAQVVCSPDVPPLLVSGIRDFGAEVHLAPVDKQLEVVEQLVLDGYFPGSRSMPPQWVTPYGCEGYKTIAYEIVDELRAAPDCVVVPVGGGDGLYGIHQGFRELVLEGSVDRVPRMVAARTDWPGASSIAFDDMGEHASDAVAASGGAVIPVSDTEIRDAVRVLAQRGISAEPASAASVAAARRPGVVRQHEAVVAVVTGAGLKWKDIQ